MTDPGPVRFSHLRAYGMSGMHGYRARFDPEAQASYAMQRGTAVHALLFETRKVVGYHAGKNRNGKAYDEFVLAHPNTEILTHEDYIKAQRMADAVRASKLAQPWLQGIVEKTIFFRWNGMDCRSTPDVRGPDFVTELKTSATSHPARFQWHALKMCYHAQLRMESIAAGFVNGYAAGDGVEHHHIVAVESTPPYPVTVFVVAPRALEIGEKMLMLWSETLKVCEASKQFPPYSQTVVELDVPDDEPDYVFPEAEE